jgi:hypothetical protein
MFALPNIRTEVSKEKPMNDLNSIDRTEMHNTGAGQTNLFGYTMDMSLAYTDTSSSKNQQGKERKIPQNYDEAFANLRYISSDNSGSNNKYYNGQQLKQIARNLGIKDTGGKKSQAEVLINAILERYGRVD